MIFEETITINAPRETIFSIYADVENWPSWDKGVISATMNGAFKTGTTGKLKPQGEPEAVFALIDVTENESFTVECKLPLCKMQFIHELTAVDGGTKVMNKVTMTGLSAPLFKLLIGSKLGKGMSESMQDLKNLAEKQA